MRRKQILIGLFALIIQRTIGEQKVSREGGNRHLSPYVFFGRLRAAQAFQGWFSHGRLRAAQAPMG